MKIDGDLESSQFSTNFLSVFTPYLKILDLRNAIKWNRINLVTTLNNNIPQINSEQLKIIFKARVFENNSSNKFFKNLEKIRKINIYVNKFIFGETFLDTISNLKVTSLNFIYDDMKDFSLYNRTNLTTEIVKSITVNEAIKEVSFKNCQYFTCEGIQALLSAPNLYVLKFKTKVNLALHENIFTELENNTNLIKLVLIECSEIADTIGMKIKNMISKNRTLEELIFDDFRISFKVIEKIGQEILNNEVLKKVTLKTFDVNYCNKLKQFIIKNNLSHKVNIL